MTDQRRRAVAYIMGPVPPCWGQCYVHQSGKNLRRKCGGKPKAKKERDR